mgnify:CR=1 FL=1
MRKPIRIIKAGEIRDNYSMNEAIDAMRKAFSIFSSGEGFVPQNYVSRLPSGEMVMLLKPAYVETEKQVSVKFLTQREGGPIPGVPTIQGIILLLNAMSGGIMSADNIAGELGDYCLGRVGGRESEEEITVFKSVGVAIQDFVVAGDIYASSLEKPFGTDFRLFE